MVTPEIHAALADVEAGRVAYDGHADLPEDPHPSEALVNAFKNEVRGVMAERALYNGGFHEALLRSFDGFVENLKALPDFTDLQAEAEAELVWQQLGVFNDVTDVMAAQVDDEEVLVARAF